MDGSWRTGSGPDRRRPNVPGRFRLMSARHPRRDQPRRVDQHALCAWFGDTGSISQKTSKKYPEDWEGVGDFGCVCEVWCHNRQKRGHASARMVFTTGISSMSGWGCINITEIRGRHISYGCDSCCCFR